MYTGQNIKLPNKRHLSNISPGDLYSKTANSIKGLGILSAMTLFGGGTGAMITGNRQA